MMIEDRRHAIIHAVEMAEAGDIIILAAKATKRIKF